MSVIEGFLSKKSGVVWKRRYFILRRDRIEYFNRENDSEARGLLALNGSSRVLDLQAKPFGFQIISDNKALMVNAENEEEKNNWKNAVLGVINSYGVAERPRDIRVYHVSGSDFVLDSKYEFIKTIGNGAYGVVISANDTSTDTKVAIKKITNAFDDLVDAKRIVREIRLLRSLSHENVIKIVDILPPTSVEDFNDVYIVSELMETDLHKVIYSRQALSNDHIQYFLYQLLCAMKYIHSASVIHRDLKPSNILLNANCDLKICDFGLSRVDQQGGQPMTEYVVTRWYRAPEIMLACQSYTAAIDMWSIGCIFGEMLNRKPLFPGTDYINQLKLIAKFVGTPGEADLDFITNPKAKTFMINLPRYEPVDLVEQFPTATREALDLLEKMLNFNPSRRITVQEALEHEYLSSLHEIESETIANAAIDCSDIESAELTKRNLQRFIYQDMCFYHPEFTSELSKF